MCQEVFWWAWKWWLWWAPLIYEECERDAPCATSSRVEGFVCASSSYTVTQYFFARGKLIPVTTPRDPRVHTTSYAYLSFDSHWSGSSVNGRRSI